MIDRNDPDAYREFERLRRHIEAVFNPSASRAVQEVQKKLQDALNPPALRAMEEAQKRIHDAVNPSAMRAMEEINKKIHDALNPPAMRAMVGLSRSLSMTYGGNLAGYATVVGRAVIEHADKVPSPDSAEIEAALKGFVTPKLSPTEVSVLYWVFAVTISVLMAGGAALSEEAAWALQTLLGFLMFFLALHSIFKK